MTDNEKLIEEAAKAIFEVGWKTHMTHWHESGHQYAYRERAHAALAVFEKAHTPTDDERENRLEYVIDAAVPVDDFPAWRFRYSRSIADAVRAAGFRRSEVPELSAERWSTEDRREALAEGLRRWSVQSQHDRVEQRDHDLYGMGARQGFALGAEWWKMSHPVAEPQGEPSDAQVEAAARAIMPLLDTSWPSYSYDEITIPERKEELHDAVRAALRAGGVR